MKIELIKGDTNPVAAFFSTPSATPETDAALIASEGQWSFVLKETCQKLERERDAAREERDIARLERDEAIADYQRVYKERDDAVAECKSLWSLVNENKLRAYKAERERDEAREALSAAKHYLTKERDDALSQIVQAECRAERFCQERDEAREKVAKLQEIISQCLDCTKILSAAKEGEQ